MSAEIRLQILVYQDLKTFLYRADADKTGRKLWPMKPINWLPEHTYVQQLNKKTN